MKIEDFNSVQLRSAFRNLLNDGKATVPEDKRPGQTAARWLASCSRSDLMELIDTQQLRYAISQEGPRVMAEGATEAAAITQTPVAAPPALAGGVEALLAAVLAPHLKAPSADPAALKAMVDAEVQRAIQAMPPKEIFVRTDNTAVTIDGAQHSHLPRLLKYVAQRIHVFIIGPAGTGKSHAAHQAAISLNLDFYSISVGQQSTQVDLFGYMNAHGTYVGTQFREAYEKGGVFCLDEMDGGSANVLNALNSALANGSVAFPDRRVNRHPDFVCVATGNTWGNGRTVEYVGRAALDGAFLSRFARLFWPVDESLEKQLGPVPAWTVYVQGVRKLFSEKGIKAVIAPRISIDGGRMLKAGQSVADTLADYIHAGLSEDAIATLKQLGPNLPKVAA